MDQFYQTPPSHNPSRRRYFAIAIGAIIVALVAMLAYIFKDDLTGLFTGASPSQLDWGGAGLEVNQTLPCLAPVRTELGDSFNLDTEERFKLYNHTNQQITNIQALVSATDATLIADTAVTVSSGTYSNGTWTIPAIDPGGWQFIRFQKSGVQAQALNIRVAAGRGSLATECLAQDFVGFNSPNAPAPNPTPSDDPGPSGPTPGGPIIINQNNASDTSKAEGDTATTTDTAAAPAAAATPAAPANSGKVYLEDTQKITTSPIKNQTGGITVTPPSQTPSTPSGQNCVTTRAGLNTINATYRVLKNEAVVDIAGNGCVILDFTMYRLGPNQEVQPFSAQVPVETKQFTLGFGTHYISLATPPCSFQSDLYLPGDGNPLAYDWYEHGCATPPPAGLTCAPATQTLAGPGDATFTATGGSGSYTWNSTGGNPTIAPTGPSATFSFAAAGNYTVTVFSGSATATCAVTVSGGTTPPSPTLTCAPATQSVPVNQKAAFTASSTDKTVTFSWQATGGSPASGTGASFQTSYTAAGNKSVVLTGSNGQTTTCAVTVTSTTTPPTTLACAPANQSVQTGTQTTFNATGAGPTYTWTNTANVANQDRNPSGPSASFTFTQAGSYTVTVASSGQTANCAVTVTAVTPPPATLTCAPASQTIAAGGTANFTATGGTGSYTWSTTGDNPTKPPTGASTSFTYGAAGSFTATVSSGTQTAHCNVTVQAVTTQQNADLAITKSVSNPTPQLNGQSFIYTVVITNIGPNNATGISVRDTLPAGVTYISSSTTQGTFSANDGTWTVGALNVGRNASLQITARANATGTHTNTATITASSLPDSVSTNNSAAVNITVTTGGGSIPTYDVAIDKVVSNANPDLNQNTQYTITATNNGTGTVTGVVINDDLPSGVEYVSHTTSTGTYSSSNGLWNIGTMTAGATATLRIVFTPENTGTTVNTASLDDMDQTDSNSSNNQDSASITVSSGGGGGGGGGSSRADVAVSKSVDNARPSLNQNVTFTVLVFNNGPRDAEDVEVRDALPAGLAYVSHSASQGSYSSSSGTWTVGDIDDGDNAILTITATAAQIGTFVNTATISDSSPNDPNDDNDEDSATVTVGSSGGSSGADLAVSKTVSNSLPAVGSQIVYSISVYNLGPQDATGVTVLDTLPSGLTFVKAEATLGSYNKSNGTWTVGSLPSGGSAVLQLTVSVTKVGTIVNTARTGNSSQPDPNGSNNESQVSITSHTAPGLPAAGLNTAAPIVIGFLFILLSIVVQFLGGMKQQTVLADRRRTINTRDRLD